MDEPLGGWKSTPLCTLCRMLFETERLRARRLTSADVDALHAVYGHVGAMKYVGDGEPLDRDGCANWVTVTDANFEKRGYGMIALEGRSTGEVIGFAGIVHPDQQPEAELKYAFRQDQWGRGLATEAAIGITNFARANWNVKEIIATVHPDHAGSMKVLSKAGFLHVRDRVNDDGSVTSVWVLG